MQDEYYYSGSGFYEESDASINATFTDVSDLPCALLDCVTKKARRYGQWWTLTGVAPYCAYPIEAQKRLRQQYTQVVTLNHPNVTRMIAMVQTSVMPDECIIEEYIDGVTLDEFMLSDPDEGLRHKLLEQIIDALQYCHRKGVTHGNLSPKAVKVTHQDYVVKLVAFECKGRASDDVRALGEIIDLLGLDAFKAVAEHCRKGEITDIETVRKAISHSKSHHWQLGRLFVALLAIVVVAFWAGHHTSMVHDKELADSLPLPGIYFSDTVDLSLMAYTEDYNHIYSTVSSASIYYLNFLKQPPGDISENIAVDLGLTVLWAPFNLGSVDADVNHVGGHFLWCDTLGLGPFVPMDKYWPSSRPMQDITSSSYDEVRRIWGHGWRMPTHREWVDLVKKCKWSLVRRHGIPLGYKVHGPSGASIFLPMAGYKLRYRDHQIGTVGRYWTSTPVVGLGRNAFAVHFDTIDINLNDTVSLEYGLAIRPVLDKL